MRSGVDRRYEDEKVPGGGISLDIACGAAFVLLLDNLALGMGIALANRETDG